jgi:hypothetical protein
MIHIDGFNQRGDLVVSFFSATMALRTVGETSIMILHWTTGIALLGGVPISMTRVRALVSHTCINLVHAFLFLGESSIQMNGAFWYFVSFLSIFFFFFQRFENFEFFGKS